ncbi:MAG: hypothetical protein WC789_04535 [Lentisphaeria bacterium]|jgi:hypothetical protein
MTMTSTAANRHPGPPGEIPQPAECPPPRWSVGTLSYTRGGLLALFGWLLWGDFAWSMKERAIGPVGQLLRKKR